MALISTTEKNKLYLKVKHVLGYPLRPFEITNEMMDSYLEIVIEDYSSLVNNWLIKQQWVSLEGLNRENSDFLAAFTHKSNAYMKSFTYAYSKQLGLGTNAPGAKGWELKRDFIITEENTQHYLIPKGREVNEVLWETPPIIDGGLVDPFALNAWSSGLMGMSYLGRPALYVQPTFSTLLAAQDRRMKQRVLQSILTYRITGLETGEKLLHLYPVPNDRYEIANSWGKHYAGRKVWYWYYDTNNGKDRDRCLEENDDVVRLPSDPPTKVLKWEDMNDVAQQQIRNLLIAQVKIVIGGVRGFYSGELGVSEKQLTMDYRHLLEEGTKLKEDTERFIIEQLDKISQVNLTEERAKIAENVNRERGFQPLQYPIIVI
ncbi:MAG TPA: hypothetical protein PLN85_00690 [archaeon]|jgi:hypothetical protein|nr:hypothetical protein [archaeon]